jgi:uroporphyrin-3 C-methyltransferase
VDTTSQPETTKKAAEKKNGSNKTSLALSAIAIAIALAAGVGLYGLVKQQSTNQTATSDALVNQLTALQKAQETQKTELESVIKQQATALAEANSKQEELTKQLGEVQQKVATISGTDAKTWLLSQADFLVKLAGRKLWSDQDVTTAATLLKSADASLADMNDPSLITARRAITADIASLSAVSQVDYDGIILKVNQLSNQIDNLQLADNNDDDSPMDSDGTELSSSLSEWRVNLQKAGRTLWTASLQFVAATKPPYRCWLLIRIFTCAKTFVPACWLPHRPYHAIRKRPINRRWIMSLRGYVLTTIPMMRRPPHSSKILIS